MIQEKDWRECGDYIAHLPERHDPERHEPERKGLLARWTDDWSLPPLASDPDNLHLPRWAEFALLITILTFTLALVVYGIWLGPAVAR